MIEVVVQLTMTAWLLMEAGLLIRDRIHGKGSAARDQGTLWLNIVIITAAVVAAGLVTGALKNAGPWEFGSTGLSAAGLLVMWTGLAVRIWAIVVLGNSFRTTVEVDNGQRVVDTGPYRWVRHPSYTGIVLLLAGLGLVYGNWPALVILLVLPAGVLIHRIFVEEAVLTEVIGRPYADYAAHTKRLVPDCGEGLLAPAVSPCGTAFNSRKCLAELSPGRQFSQTFVPNDLWRPSC